MVAALLTLVIAYDVNDCNGIVSDTIDSDGRDIRRGPQFHSCKGRSPIDMSEDIAGRLHGASVKLGRTARKSQATRYVIVLIDVHL